MPEQAGKRAKEASEREGGRRDDRGMERGAQIRARRPASRRVPPSPQGNTDYSRRRAKSSKMGR